ncbi:polyubiquitin-tagged protein recognition complex, Npl4 component [Leucogyrophana mollusca]|uniref:Polyubiquitin-tagged protein recognition complex, Npl4 component n=1 Tax=Leucogyrophana mollusca TaxID=85980 RepID=A0ACB8BGU5_9AGAM|nr:polyubiquitin-tagged protein recognition complex, Npl4 component [Leucogyrophana mollusca]
MLIRVRSKDGNFRFEFSPTADISELVNKILETTVDADSSSITISNQPRGNETKVSKLKGRTLQALGLKHGDLVFVGYQAKAAPSSSGTEADAEARQPAKGARSTTNVWDDVQEDVVDITWRSQDGKIPRGRDSRFCKHGVNGMCDYCMPLEPYDAAYHAEHSIKHLSYHAYLRKLTPKSSSAAASAIPPLSPLSYKVKVPCPSGGHPSWPAGICTACQPSAITLQSQPFRMVDHLEIASMEIIERFLQAWRATGLQRFGWLIGRYEPYDKVPMGIKAVVEAIYEPPQEGELDGLTLGIPWEEEPRIRALAKSASTPLTVVGYIFTDLDPTPEDRTKNVYKRHPQSFFLSSLEAIFAATVQKANPTPSKSSSSGTFGSRLVTAILTATEDGQVDVSAYQVSEQACAMVDADMIEASVEPGIVRVKEEDRSHDAARYVPDVFFRYKNEYGLEVKKSAKPCFPVEYLLVNVTHGFPQNPSPLFRSSKFAIENRPGLEDQRVESVLSSLSQLGAPDIQDSRHAASGDAQKRLELAKWLSDWHLVAFLGTTQLFSQDDMNVLIRTVSSPTLLEDSSSLDALMGTDGWHTLMTFTRESAPVRPSSSAPGQSTRMDEDIPQELLDQIAAEESQHARSGAGAAGGSRIRVCPHCTFENEHGGSDCEVCGLPLG